MQLNTFITYTPHDELSSCILCGGETTSHTYFFFFPYIRGSNDCMPVKGPVCVGSSGVKILASITIKLFHAGWNCKSFDETWCVWNACTLDAYHRYNFWPCATYDNFGFVTTSIQNLIYLELQNQLITLNISKTISCSTDNWPSKWSIHGTWVMIYTWDMSQPNINA